MHKKAEIYEASDGWRFRIKAGNGEIIADGEAYKNKADCLANVESLRGEADWVIEYLEPGTVDVAERESWPG